MRSLLFIVPTALQAVVTFVTMPIMVSSVGFGKWAPVAVAQAAGALVAVAVAMGWSISGPTELSSLGDATSRFTLLKISAYTRMLIYFPANLLALATFAIIGHDGWLLEFLAFGATVGLGLTQMWYFAATGDPLRVLLLESLPKSVITLVGWLLVRVFALSPEVGMIIQSCACGVAFVLVLVYARKRTVASAAISIGTLRDAVRRQSDAFLTQAPGAVFAQVPVIVVAIAAPGAAAGFSIIDRVQKLFQTASAPIVNVIVSRVFGASGPAGGVNHLAGRLYVVGAGAAVLVASFSIAPFLVHYFSSGAYQLSCGESLLVALGNALGFVASAWPAVVLAPLGRLGSARRASLFGSAVGVFFVWVLSAAFGVPGALLGVAAGFQVVIVWQLCASGVRRA